MWYYDAERSVRDLKELFSLKGSYSIIPNESDGLFLLTDFNSMKNSVLDSYGNPTNRSFYDMEYDADLQCDPDIDDPTQFSEPVNGFYVYTTHECHYDPDGAYGCFGVKRVNGEKLTEECFYQVGAFSNGLCPVCLEDEKWGCINEKGTLVIPYQFAEAPIFNKYGVACGDKSLIDIEGHPIPGTELNYFGGLFEDQRYVEIALWSDEIDAEISKCGTAPNLTVDIYDTKERSFVARGVPDGKLDIDFCDAEKEVVIAAIKMLPQFDEIKVEKKKTILARKGEMTTVFDYYA